ncbi:hypothetical protein [Kitasatospora sp. NPDC005856]|uniref:hypothetical protein n=1 Tax=Kitasatospora sp. NPDC005856 TaxID=3154566 RepID=UPI0033FD8295
MTRIGLHSWSSRGIILSAVLLLLALEGVAVGVAPGRLRLFLCGLLIGASVAALLLAQLLGRSHRAHRRSAVLPVGDDDAQWFSARTLEGFPMDEVRPLLRAPGAPGLNRLYTAWVFATHGHDPQWIAHHLDLPPSTTRVLVDAAHRHTAPLDDSAHPQV